MNRIRHCDDITSASSSASLILASPAGFGSSSKSSNCVCTAFMRSCSKSDFDWIACNISLRQSTDCNSKSTPCIPTVSEPESTEKVLPTDDAVASKTGLVEQRSQDDRRTATDRRQSKSSEANATSDSIRVGIDKIDAIVNLVGELIITQSMLSRFGEKDFDESDKEALSDGLNQLSRHTRELQESVLQIRMLPISFSFNRFPRLVRDLSNKLGKKMELKLHGEQTELDKTVLEKIGDPLVHLSFPAQFEPVIPIYARVAGKRIANTHVTDQLLI